MYSSLPKLKKLKRLILKQSTVTWKDLINSVNSKTNIPELKCVYVIEFESGLVKIGISGKFENRLNHLITLNGFNSNREYHTVLLDKKTSFLIERESHKYFEEYRTNGEYFKINFDDACRVVGNLVEKYTILT